MEKAKFNPFSNKGILISSFILGFLFAIIGISFFGLYFILNSLAFSYVILIFALLMLVLMMKHENKNKFILINILITSVSITLQLLFILSRSYVVSFFASLFSLIAGICFSILSMQWYEQIPNRKKANEEKTSKDLSKKSTEEKKQDISEKSTEEKTKVFTSTKKDNAKCVGAVRNKSLTFKISTVVTVFILIFCIVASVFIHILAINGMYYSSLSLGYAKEYKDISYGPYGKRNTMTIYVPRSALDRDENAAMVFLHPGGWNAGDKNICSADARRFAKEGYITMFMNYRFLNDSNDFGMDDLLCDITLGLTKLKEYSAKKGWNITKISLNGYSAGAHLSMLYGYKCKDKSPFEISYIAAKAGVFIFNEPSYYTPDIIYTGGVYGGKLHNSPIRYDSNGNLLPTKDVIYKQEVLDVLKEISPITYMSPDNPPLIQCYGNEDNLISIKQVGDIKKHLTLEPFKNEIFICDKCSHLFLENHKALKSYYDRVNVWAKHFFGY
ncbi:MAG TPA: carboxylesterase family protein [Clostridiales bacterium]|nr:carboxylesterase family protein [Clostridiales bacterium]